MPPKLKSFHFVKVALLALCGQLALGLGTAAAVSIELKDDAPDRIERQRAAASGKLPLPGTPDTSKFESRLAELGLKPGAPMLIRIFKAQSELEVWMEKDGAYVLFANYPICHWSGTLGPKIQEGDKQTPEGFYTITSRQLHRMGRWTRALNLGFPNAYDESLKRDGSYILVHGGCSSVGCFAMTNPVIDEIYTLTSSALRNGQRYVPVHVFPFRMTEENLTRHKDSQWYDFWVNLKEGYDAFETTKRPPYVSVCNSRYNVQAMSQSTAASPLEVGASSPLAVCGQTAAALLDSDKSAWLVPIDQTPTAPQSVPAQSAEQQRLSQPAMSQQAQPETPVQPQQVLLPSVLPAQSPVPQANPVPTPAAAVQRSATSPSGPRPDPLLEPEKRTAVASIDLAAAYELIPRLVAPQPKPGSKIGSRERTLPCSLARASCRKFAALLDIRTGRKTRLAARAAGAAARLR